MSAFQKKPTDTDMLKGGCRCGAVRYETAGQPFNATLCHCRDCRSSSGAPFVAWFSVAPSSFRLVSAGLSTFVSSEKVVREFCSTCGTPITFRHQDHPEEIDVTTCSLDDPARVLPADHIWTDTQLSWIHLADDLPKHGRTR